MSIDKTYDPAATEARLYSKWEDSGAFACDPTSKVDPYCIMIPPPNVTGSLHMGHGLTFTIQDTLIRFARMRGRDTLWQPGTDHAGIATQMVVERELAKEGLDRRTMGREKFLEKVWQWKAESGGTITKQLRRLGASLDWPRERFTLDPALNRAVNKVFVQLYNEKLIYKDKRLVNWDPKMLSAISDLEVESKEIKGNLWYFHYPIDGSDEMITVATTRPETMLGDTAVAVHPENGKLKHLIGKMVRLPLTDRLIPVVGDEYADPEKGTGAVKITPAHDFNDFEVGKRHNLEMINIFDKHAILNENTPEKYRGMERFEARKQIIADMESLGLLEKIEPHVHAVPHGDRSGVPIEPWLSEQWYCDAKTLAAPALKAVEEGHTKFVPEQWTNTYYAWMRNIEPWCISRQLWWGHQIPAWYGPDGQVFVAHDEEEANAMAQKAYGKATPLTRDEDVLDTWFSSALWPFSTLGWPEQTPELERYYPTDVLVTGFDIIFFWVARMMMMGLHFMGDVPFRTVYMHALVRDAKGQKMSKTKGNVMDPLDIIGAYGCDALRFTLCTLSTPGRDIKLAPARIESSRNFATKLWNAARYCQMNECVWQADFNPASVKQTINKWIIGETVDAVNKVASQLDAYRFDLSSHSVYEFVWNVFCDWYLEFTKPILSGTDEAAKAETRATTAWVLGQMLKMMHPFMPYITEELWEHVVGDGTMLITTRWPSYDTGLATKEAQNEMNWVVRVITAIRGVRAELNVPASAKIETLVKGASDQTQKRLATHGALIERLARLSAIGETATTPANVAQTIIDETTFILPLEGVIDIAQEKERLAKECAKWAEEIKKVEAKLANPSFVDRAPEDVVEEHKERLENARAMVAKLGEAQKSLAA
ncbi:MAG: valine--tRNA ligase [Alphaproteobacteria bacterium]|jgi:valyl-tRNA synthetase|nr:valine--tRNA ligase [Alphaproteobacteria bacterium]